MFFIENLTVYILNFFQIGPVVSEPLNASKQTDKTDIRLYAQKEKAHMKRYMNFFRQLPAISG